MSRVKTIVIAMLALINAFFLALIVIDAVAEAYTERQTLDNVCAIMRRGGIEVRPDDIGPVGAIRTMRTARVLEVEEGIARAFLGPAAMVDQGVIYLYENAERGAAVFASAGDFEIRMVDGAITDESGPVSTVSELLKGMGLETSAPAPPVELDSDAVMVTVVGTYRGASIFNCLIEFVFEGGSLQVVRGRYVAGVEPVEGGAEISRVETALLGFLAAVGNEDKEFVDCKRIYSVEAGYRQRVSGSFGEGYIAPAWMIATDNGRFLMDDATWEIWAF